jgi:hypothetical protein
VFAYLDAGTGSMLVQLVVGGVAAIGVMAKFYWRRFLKFLHIRKDEPETVSAQPETVSAKPEG